LQVSLYCDPNLQKGQVVGVEAMRSMKSLVPSVRLCSVGRVLPRYAKVFDRNYGYLHKEKLVQALQESDIFVYPSLYDGFPAPPLQAMACGAALVTTAVEGVLEYAREGENCLLCPPGQAPAMREQVLRLVRDAELRQRLQSNGSQTAQGYSVERSAGQLLEFLKEVYQE
jgi:glycosyltransferase involved in cell wall biosynthesis